MLLRPAGPALALFVCRVVVMSACVQNVCMHTTFLSRLWCLRPFPGCGCARLRPPASYTRAKSNSLFSTASRHNRKLTFGVELRSFVQTILPSPIFVFSETTNSSRVRGGLRSENKNQNAVAFRRCKWYPNTQSGRQYSSSKRLTVWCLEN